VANSKLSPNTPVVKGITAQPLSGKALIKAAKAARNSGPNKLSKAAAQALIAHHAKMTRQVAPGLTYGQLQRDTSAATGLKYGAASQALRGQVVQNEAQGARTADWYTQYQNAIAQAAAQQQAQNQAAVAGVQGLQQGLDASSMKAWAGQQAAMAADAANRGATVDPALADQAHNASNIRNALTGSYGAMLASQGAAQQAGLSDRKVTAGQQGLEALRLNASQRADLANQRTAFEKEKGQFKTQFQQQEKSDAADTALKNVLTQAQAAEYGANAAQSLASARSSNASAGKTRTETAFVQKYGYLPGSKPSALDQAKLNFFNKHGYFPKTGPTTPKGTATPKAGQPVSGPGSLTRSQEQTYLSQIHTIIGYYEHPPVGADGKPLSAAQISAMLQSGKNPLKKSIDPRVINVARSAAGNNGKLGPWGIKNAHSLGIHVGGNFGTVSGPAAPVVNGNPGRIGN